MAFINKLLRATEGLTPLSTLTSLSGFLTDKELGFFTQYLIRQFIKSFNINLDEIKEQDLSTYTTFNAFFTRELAEGQRPLGQSLCVSPVDGTIGSMGHVSNGRLIQAKGIDYSLLELVGGDQHDASFFANKPYVCIYLSPSNYHRIHMPIDGDLIKTIHVPCRHFPVGKKNISYLENLYTLNERLVCIFETAIGRVAIVMVGAALVGSISTPWSGTIKRRSLVEVKNYAQGEHSFNKGDEIGLFKYGSTVIALFERQDLNFDSNVKELGSILYGANLLNPPI